MRYIRNVLGTLVCVLWAIGCSDAPMEPLVEPPPFHLGVESVLNGSHDAWLSSSAFADERPALEGEFTRPLAELPGAELSGGVANVGLGCEGDPYLADPNGKIALIERGVCEFTAKIERAQTAGAIAVIVYNSEVGGETLVRMAPADAPRATIPGVFVQRSTGLQLIAATPPVTATMRVATDLELLDEAIEELGEAGLLNDGQITALLQKLAAAQAQIAVGNFDAAINILKAFINQVNQLVADGAISAEDGGVLIALAQAMIDDLTT